MHATRSRHPLRTALTALAVATLAAAAQSTPTFIDPGNGTIIDNFTGLMWLRDANLSRTQGWDADGQMSWSASMAWVQHLNDTTYAGYADWRLWRIDGRPYCTGLGCADSEMAELFTDLGGQPGCSIYTCHNDNFHLFVNVQGRPGQNPVAYWSESAAALPGYEVTYNMLMGDQGSAPASEQYYAWAVRIPEPGSLPLVLAAVCGAWVAGRRAPPAARPAI